MSDEKCNGVWDLCFGLATTSSLLCHTDRHIYGLLVSLALFGDIWMADLGVSDYESLWVDLISSREPS